MLVWAILLLVALALPLACTDPKPQAETPKTAATETEQEIRKRLGIPDSAVHVLMLSQSSHMDLDWRESFEGYYAKRVEGIFLAARKWLDDNPTGHYSIAELAFLQHHLKVHVEEAALLANHIKRGTLHLVGGGMTSPDTLLPETELLAHDWMYGAQFAADQLGARPWAAWIPDSFGHAATTPDMLQAAGLHAVAMARIDGAPTLFEELAANGVPLKPESTAAYLKTAGSADFLWNGPGGGQVLGHFLAGFGLYCQGDDLDYEEVLQTEAGHTGAYKGDDAKFTDARLDHYSQELLPWSKTPYQFVPVGCDFQSPKPKLLDYIKGYNERQFALTKTWVVSASFEDYAKLVLFHKDVLPVVTGELSPVYMGFYASRATLKRKVRDAARPFFQAEMLAAAAGTEGRNLHDAARPSLSALTRADHHDYVTGTSADTVVAGEQMPQLAQLQAAGHSYLHAAATALAGQIGGPPGVQRMLAVNAAAQVATGTIEMVLPTSQIGSGERTVFADDVPLPTELTVAGDGQTAALRVQIADVPPWGWRMLDLRSQTPPAPKTPVAVVMTDLVGNPVGPGQASRLTLDNGQVHVEWVREAGHFILTQLKIGGNVALGGSSPLVHAYDDTGGLWRMGHEMANCQFKPVPLGNEPTETMQVVVQTPLLARIRFVGRSTAFEVSLGAGDAALGLAADVSATEGLTKAMTLHLTAPDDAQLVVSTPFGAVQHPPSKLFTPTYWPAVAWVKVGPWVVALQQSTGVRMDKPGQLEILTARDVRSEQCDVMGGTGTDGGVHHFAWQIGRAETEQAAEQLGQAFNRPVQLVVVPAATAVAGMWAGTVSLATVGSGSGVVTAIKPAEQAAGSVIRAQLTGPTATLQVAGPWQKRQWTLVDLAERAVGPLVNSAGGVGLVAPQKLRVVSVWGL